MFYGQLRDGLSRCRYSALVFADYAKQTLELLESRVYATRGTSDCAEGQAVLDAAFAKSDYIEWGSPHRISIMIEDENAAAMCGEGATKVGIDFRFTGAL